MLGGESSDEQGKTFSWASSQYWVSSSGLGRYGSRRAPPNMLEMKLKKAMSATKVFREPASEDVHCY